MKKLLLLLLCAAGSAMHCSQNPLRKKKIDYQIFKGFWSAKHVRPIPRTAFQGLAVRVAQTIQTQSSPESEYMSEIARKFARDAADGFDENKKYRYL